MLNPNKTVPPPPGFEKLVYPKSSDPFLDPLQSSDPIPSSSDTFKSSLDPLLSSQQTRKPLLLLNIKMYAIIISAIIASNHIIITYSR